MYTYEETVVKTGKQTFSITSEHWEAIMKMTASFSQCGMVIHVMRLPIVGRWRGRIIPMHNAPPVSTSDLFKKFNVTHHPQCLHCH